MANQNDHVAVFAGGTRDGHLQDFPGPAKKCAHVFLIGVTPMSL
jgi:hypothetical protein